MDKITELIRSELQPEPGTAAASASPNGTVAASASSGTAAPAESPQTLPTTSWESLSAEDQAHWERFILKQISRFIKIIDDKANRDLLVAAIKEVGLNDIVGDTMGLVMYCFDSKNFGESFQRPDLRYPPANHR